MHRFIIKAALLSLLGAHISYAANFKLSQDQAVFAVITHKAGLASGLAHDHVVTAGAPTVSMEATPNKLETAAFNLQCAAKELRLDEAAITQRWFPRFEALGILTHQPSEVSASDQKTIRESMLDKSQLDADTFPQISAKLLSLAAKESTMGKEKMTHEAKVALTIHGKTVEKTVPAKVLLTDASLEVEAAGEFKFSDFGITPYSAFLGAVKVADPFHIYASFKAAP